MAAYISRHSPRRQMIVSGKIASGESYDRFYDMTWEALQGNRMPLLTAPAGSLLFRWLSLDIEKARTIAPAEKSSKSLSNRYSGARLDGKPGQGALYLATLGALLRENVHYSGPRIQSALWTPGDPDQLRAAVTKAAVTTPSAGAPKYFHVYRLKHPLRLANIRAVALVTLFRGLLLQGAHSKFGLNRDVSAEVLAQRVVDPSDYSAARGMADAIGDLAPRQKLDGMTATSARGDTDSGAILDAYGDGVEGYVYAVFGPADRRLDVLEPVSSYASFKDLQSAVKTMPGFSWIA